MAINKEIITDNKATAITYWKYMAAQNINPFNKSAVMIFGGYTTVQARDEAKFNGRAPDYLLPFDVKNLRKRYNATRDLTLEEKREVLLPQTFTDDQLNAMPMTTTEDAYNDFPYFDQYYKAICQAAANGSPDVEIDAAYQLVKTQDVGGDFYTNATDLK